VERDLAKEDIWYFDSVPLDSNAFAILAAPPELETIAQHVPSKSIAYLMSAAPQLLRQLKRCRPFVLHSPDILRDVDRAIAWAEGTIETEGTTQTEENNNVVPFAGREAGRPL
jgi:hypothetical protein